MSKKAVAQILCVFAVALGAAGCGGGDDSDSGAAGANAGAAEPQSDATGENAAAGDADSEGGAASKTVSRARLEERATAICASAVEDFQAAFKSLGKRSKDGAAGMQTALASRMASILQVEADEIAELGLPHGDEAQVEAIVAAIEDAAAEAERNPGEIAQINQKIKRAGDLADEYGLTACPLG